MTSGHVRGQQPLSTRRLRMPEWLGEVLLVIALYVVYELARGVHRGTQHDADVTGRTLLTWERWLHIDPEKWLTLHLDSVTWLAVPASYFYATMHYVVTPAVLIWLYVRHRHTYRQGRTWLAVSTMMALVVFYLLPTTPPRLLGYGFPDVLKDTSAYGWWGGAGSAPQGLGHLTNQLAAMPSMHVGWALWCGVMIYRHSPVPAVRLIGAAYPVLTTLVVISTGNHYLLDTVAGVLVMGLGAVLSKLGYRVVNATRQRMAHDRTRAGRSTASDSGAGPGTQHPGADGTAEAGPEAQRSQNSLHTTIG